MERKRLWAPLRARNVRLLIGGTGLSQIGDWLYNVALIVFVFDRTGSATWVAAAGIVRLVPYVLFGTIGGMIADRRPRRDTMIASDVIRAAGHVRDDGRRRARGFACARGGPGRRRNDLLRRLRPLRERGDPAAGRRGRPLGREHAVRDRHEPQLRARPRPRRGPADPGVALGGSRRQRVHVPDLCRVHGDDPWRPRPGCAGCRRCPDRGGRRDLEPGARRRASCAHVEPLCGRARGDPGDDQRAVRHGDGAVRARVDGSTEVRGRRRRLPLRSDRSGRDRRRGARAAALRTVGRRPHPGGLGGHVRTAHGDTRIHPCAERRDRRVVARGRRDDRRGRHGGHLLATAARRRRARPGLRNARLPDGGRDPRGHRAGASARREGQGWMPHS